MPSELSNEAVLPSEASDCQTLDRRSSAKLRAAIVCALYDVYALMQGIKHPCTRDAAFTQQHPLPTTATEARRRLMDAPACIAERVGEYVLFAPLSLFPEAEGSLYTPCPDEDTALQRELREAWEQFCEITQLSHGVPKQFYVHHTFPRRKDYRAFFIAPTHCPDTKAGMERLLQASLVAIGYQPNGKPHEPSKHKREDPTFEHIRPGDIVCSTAAAYGLRGFGIALSGCQNLYRVYYAGEYGGQPEWYDYYVDIAWLAGNTTDGYVHRDSLQYHSSDKKWYGGSAIEEKSADSTHYLYHYLLNTTMPQTTDPNDKTPELVELLKECHNLVLTGPPGTGKTYLATRKIAKLMGASRKQGNLEMVQFHPSYDYTDFVEGLRPSTPDAHGNISFTREDGVFKRFCRAAIKDNRKRRDQGLATRPFVFVIDEINRGELSRIFGELFFCLDPDYRVDATLESPAECEDITLVDTQYKNLIAADDPFYKGFYVPDNVYIIGTMNDIDRSVESMDFAIRRRFTWHEVTAEDSEVILAANPNLDPDAQPRMRRLNAAIASTEGLGSAYQVGGAYFAKKLKGNDYTALWERHLKGLLFEYLRGRNDAVKRLEDLKKAYDGQTQGSGAERQQ